MTRFLFGDRLWSTIERHAKKAHRTKAAIAYVTRTRPLRFRSGDLLIVDASADAIAAGLTSAAVLAQLHRLGVRLYSHPGLHAKCIVLDSHLFTSSANLSAYSVNRLLEAGIETDSPNSVSDAIGLLEKLASASDEIDGTFIHRIKQIKVKRFRAGNSSVARKVSEKRRSAATWLIGTWDIDEPTDSDELQRIQNGTALAKQRRLNDKSRTPWIHMPKKGRFAMNGQESDNVIIIDRRSKAGNPSRVFHNATVLVKNAEPTCCRLFYEQLPYAERKSLTWGQFNRLAEFARVPGKISKNSERQITQQVSDALNDKWEEVRAKKR